MKFEQYHIVTDTFGKQKPGTQPILSISGLNSTER